MRLGLVYLPDAEASVACVDLSQRLVADRRSRVVLGPRALPHVTLVHVEIAPSSSDGAADSFWDEASAAIPHEMPLVFAALAFLRYEEPYNAPPASPAMMAYAIIPCSAELRRAEEAALALAPVRRHGSTTGNRERFLPHATLAIWEAPSAMEETAPSVWTLSPELARRPRHGRLALGIIGPNGTYERTLFEAG